MTILAIDRSTDVQSAAIASGSGIVSKVFGASDSRAPDWPVLLGAFLAENSFSWGDIDEIVVGRGPGSFSGIRAALAFAQGVAIGRAGGPLPGIVRGLPSPLACTRDGERLAVVGDARRDRFWTVLYDGAAAVRDFELVGEDGLAGAVPEGFAVVSPDDARIGAKLARIFAERYRGAAVPSAARLAELAAAGVETVPEPLPIYLSAAVR